MRSAREAIQGVLLGCGICVVVFNVLLSVAENIHDDDDMQHEVQVYGAGETTVPNAFASPFRINFAEYFMHYHSTELH